MIGAARLAGVSGNATQHYFAYGELKVYNPANHTGQFALPGEPDPNPSSAEPNTVTGFIPVSTNYVAANGGGAQFPPTLGAQYIVFFLDQAQKFPICGVPFFNDVDTPPFPDGKTQGWKNDNGAAITTTNDGATVGDNAGGAHIVGGNFISIATTGGNKITLNDVTKQITLETVGGLMLVLDDNTGTIQAGGSGDNLSDGLVRKSDLVNLLSQIQSNLQTFFLAHVSNGSGNTGPTTLTSITPTASDVFLSA